MPTIRSTSLLRLDKLLLSGLSLTLLLLSSLSLPAFSAEGFSSLGAPIPDAIADVWPATVVVSLRIVDFRKIQTRSVGSTASGLIVAQSKDDGDLFVITNQHTVSCSFMGCRVRVGFSRDDGRAEPVWTTKVDVLAHDVSRDLALLRVRPPGKAVFEVVPLSDPDDRRVGQTVYAIGHPVLTTRARWRVDPPEDFKALGRRYSRGETHGIPRTDPGKEGQKEAEWVLHSADLLPGNSGGPLVSEDGEILGINAAIGYSERWVDGLEYCAIEDRACEHFAVATSEVLRLFSDYLEEDHADH